MPRKNLIAGNWKMNNTIPEAVVLAQEISNRMERDWLELVDVAVCPPFVDLKPVKSVFEFDRVDIAVGAQNVYWEPKGAFTGEISIAMIKNIGCAFCIVGHSERRNLFGETNEEVNLKARALIEADITPIICVGESLSVRDGDTYLDFVTAQVRAAYAGMDAAAEGVGRLCRRVEGPALRRPVGRVGAAGALCGRCLRAGVGHRHGSHGHARAGRGGLRRHSRHRVGHVRC